jgi:hypothetical protein
MEMLSNTFYKIFISSIAQSEMVFFQSTTTERDSEEGVGKVKS